MAPLIVLLNLVLTVNKEQNQLLILVSVAPYVFQVRLDYVIPDYLIIISQNVS